MGAGKSKVDLNYREDGAWVLAGTEVTAVTPYPGAFFGYTTREKLDLPFSDKTDEATCACFYVHFRSMTSAKNEMDAAVIRTEMEMHGSVFNNVCKVYCPNYRVVASDKDLEAAIGDIHNAFNHFLNIFWDKGPIILAGDGIGAYMVARLMQVPLLVPWSRVVSAYLPGTPVRATDFPELRRDLLFSWHTKFGASDKEPVHYCYPGDARNYSGDSSTSAAAVSAMADESKEADDGTPIVSMNPMTFSATSSTPPVKCAGAMDAEGLVYAKAVGCKRVDDGKSVLVTTSASVDYTPPKHSDILPFYMALRLGAADKYAAFKRLEAL